jgi:serine/threonine protein kinase
MIAVKDELFILEKIFSKYSIDPHIIRMFEHFIIDDKLYIFMQLASGGNLSTFLRSTSPLDESLSKVLFAQIVSGVCLYAHQKYRSQRLKAIEFTFY